MNMFKVEIAGSRYDIGVEAKALSPHATSTGHVYGTVRAVLIPEGADPSMPVAELDDVLLVPVWRSTFYHPRGNLGNLGASILLNLAFGDSSTLSYFPVCGTPGPVRAVCTEIGQEIARQLGMKRKDLE